MRAKIIAATHRTLSPRAAAALQERVRRLMPDAQVVSSPGAGMLACRVQRPDDGRPVAGDAHVACIFASVVVPR
jgi:hypothetical protein